MYANAFEPSDEAAVNAANEDLDTIRNDTDPPHYLHKPSAGWQRELIPSAAMRYRAGTYCGVGRGVKNISGLMDCLIKQKHGTFQNASVFRKINAILKFSTSTSEPLDMNNTSLSEADYLFMIEQAAKAPSGHNTQPWKFKLNQNSIDIYPDFTKSLPVVDPDNLELFVSLGCAAENLCIAASHKGYQATVSIDEINCVIQIQSAKQNGNTSSALFSQLSARQTNRSVYNGKMISDSNIESLKQSDPEPGVKVYFSKTVLRNLIVLQN